MPTLSELEYAAIEANLFPLALPFLQKRPEFPWHRHKGVISAQHSWSSQALAVGFFATIETLLSRDAILDVWAEEVAISTGGPWKLDFEVSIPKELLGEPRPTQIDVIAQGRGSLILFECKFTERDGGPCSQPIPLRDGAHRGLRQCNGDYAGQVNPTSGAQSRCALTGKGIRYWELVPQVLNIDAAADLRPCPFARGWYQWMRNLVAAAAIARERGVSAGFAVVYADGPFPMATKVRSEEWATLARLTEGRSVPLKTVSYRRLSELAEGAACTADKPKLSDLRCWMEEKFRIASQRDGIDEPREKLAGDHPL